jgi:peptidoglycan/LPS O-acetylase OafA/YrhL
MPGRRLDHVDATRPVKQAGVVSTHVLLFFAPASAAVAAGAALTLLHAARDAFFFVSACMLTYAYADLKRSGLPRFYRRRFVSVGIPYLCWTLIYYLSTMPVAHYPSAGQALWALPHLLYAGYYHLYFLIVIMQFYLVFPLVLWLLRRTAGHHGLLLAALVAIQFLLVTAMHWNVLPPGLRGVWAQREAPTYVLYLIGGAIVAAHLSQVHDWLCRNARLVVLFTLGSAIAAEVVYYLAQDGVTTVLGSGDDPFQPSVIPFNAGIIACLYLAGVALVRPGRPAWLRAVVRSGSDNAYGVYLAQLLFINALVWLGWAGLTASVPWPLLCLLTVVIVYLGSFALTSLLARTPLATPLTGRKRIRLTMRTDDDRDNTVDRRSRRQPWRRSVPGGCARHRDADLRGAEPVRTSLGTPSG